MEKILSILNKPKYIITLFIFLLFGSFFLSGCSRILTLGRTSKRYSSLPAFSPNPVHNYPNYSVGRFKIPFMAEQIAKIFEIQEIEKSTLMILPLLELDGPDNIISSFGRFFSEQLKTELYLNDFRILYAGNVLEEQILDHLTIDLDQFLTAEDNIVVNKLFNSGVEAIISGSYQVASNMVYVNVRMIMLANSEIISVGTCELNKDENIISLIEKRQSVKKLKSSTNNQKEEFFGFKVKGKTDT